MVDIQTAVQDAISEIGELVAEVKKAANNGDLASVQALADTLEASVTSAKTAVTTPPVATVEDVPPGTPLSDGTLPAPAADDVAHAASKPTEPSDNSVHPFATADPNSVPADVATASAPSTSTFTPPINATTEGS